MRNLKALGLILAVFALSAMTTSVASAQNGMITADGPFLLDAVDEGNLPTLTGLGGKTECGTISYHGGEIDATDEEGNHEALESGSSAFTLTPVYEDCLAEGSFPETITTNGCDYVVHIGKTVPTSSDRYNVTADLICPEGKEITIDVYPNEKAHTEFPAEPVCEIHIPPQKGLIGATITDEPKSNHLTLGGKMEGIEMVLTESICAPEGDIIETEGVHHLDVTVAGTDASEGEVTPLSLSH